MSTQTRHVLTSSHGFTLIELMITVAILGIIAAIATPSVSLQLANMRVKSTASTLENALKEAKAESAIRRQDIAVTYTTGGTITVGGIRTYDYDAKSTIKKNSTATSITFRPSKTASDSITYTICDSNASASPKQIVVNKLAVITTQAGGTCP